MIGPDWPKSPVKFINSTPYYIMKVALFRCIMYVFSKGTNYCYFEEKKILLSVSETLKQTPGTFVKHVLYIFFNY